MFSGKPIAEVPKLSLDPRGSTALLDAVGKTITSVAERKHGEVMIVLIITDGQENASREWKADGVKKLVEDASKAGWEFVYLGANVDAFTEAGRMGINLANAAGYDADTASVDAAFNALNLNTTNLRSGAASTMSFTDQQRTDIKKTDGGGTTV